MRSSGASGGLDLDTDDLKPINGGYGYRAGDAAIKETASRIGRNSRRVDRVAPKRKAVGSSRR